MTKAFTYTLLALIVAAGLWFGLRDQPEAVTPTTTSNTSEEAPTQSEPATGQYVDYDAEVIARTSGTKILFFHAPWCPQCRALEASIKAGAIPADTTIIKVDYDSNQALRQKYGVTLQTTLVKVDDNGDLVAKFNAYDEPSLQSVIDNLL